MLKTAQNIANISGQSSTGQSSSSNFPTTTQVENLNNALNQLRNKATIIYLIDSYEGLINCKVTIQNMNNEQRKIFKNAGKKFLKLVSINELNRGNILFQLEVFGVQYIDTGCSVYLTEDKYPFYNNCHSMIFHLDGELTRTDIMNMYYLNVQSDNEEGHNESENNEGSEHNESERNEGSEHNESERNEGSEHNESENNGSENESEHGQETAENEYSYIPMLDQYGYHMLDHYGNRMYYQVLKNQ
uniref:Tudor domain-containing protein n=1 Tax=Meloidogyne hapla TaxID=6305 RepID=A0A1I8BND0_MELHA